MLRGTENYVQDYSLKEDVFHIDEHQRKTTQNEKESKKDKKKMANWGRPKAKLLRTKYNPQSQTVHNKHYNPALIIAVETFSCRSL